MGFIQNAVQDPVGAVKGVLFGGSLVAGVEVDVLVSESHALQAEPTQIALESGAIVTDHVIREPATVEVSFEMTNTPNGMVGGIVGSAVGGLINDATGKDIVRNAKSVFEQFEKLLRTRETVKLITNHHTYEDMIVVGFNPTHSAPYKGRMQCQVRLTQITKIVTTTVGRESNNTTTKTANAKQNSGQQQTPAPKPSLAAQIKDSTTKRLGGGR